MSAGGKGFHLVGECARTRRDAAEDAHDEAELIGRPEHAHVDEGPGVTDVAGVEALHLRPHAGGVHRFEEELDVAERVREDVVMVEGLFLF